MPPAKFATPGSVVGGRYNNDQTSTLYSGQACELQVDAQGNLLVTGSIALNPTPTINAATSTTGTLGLAVGNAPYAPLFVTGSVALNPAPVITANTATTGSTGLAVGNAPYQPLFVSLTSSLPVTFAALPQLQISNFPATQNVSGTVNIGSLLNVTGTMYVTSTGSLPVAVVGNVNVVQQGQVQVSNFPATQAISGTVTVGASLPLSVWNPSSVGVTGSLGGPSGQQVWNAGQLGVSGTVGAVINNWPQFVGVSGSVSVSASGTLNVSQQGPVQVWSEGNVGVSGSVTATGTVRSWDGGVQPVSGSQLSGSTFVGSPIVVGGVFYGSGNAGNLPAYVTSLKTDFSGSLFVTASNPIPVINLGPVGISGSVSILNVPLRVFNDVSVGVSGSVSIANVPLRVYNDTNVGVSGSVSLSNYPVRVFNDVNVGVTGSVQAWQGGTVGVSGTISVGNVPLRVYNDVSVGVSGSVTIGTWGTNVTASVASGPGSAVNVTTTGSFGLAVVQTGPTNAALSGTTATLTGPNAGTKCLLLNANLGRYGAILMNNSPVNAFIQYGTSCGTTLGTFSQYLTPNSSFALPQPIYRGIITCAFTVATGSIITTEFTQ